MSRLIVKNIGPIKSVDIELKKVNVFMGPQSCGKSTLAKIISFCTWMEKTNAFEEKMMERREGREEGLAEGRKEGLAEGQSAKQEEIACKMLEKGLDFTLIAEMTGLSEKDLKALQKQG